MAVKSKTSKSLKKGNKIQTETKKQVKTPVPVAVEEETHSDDEEEEEEQEEQEEQGLDFGALEESEDEDEDQDLTQPVKEISKKEDKEEEEEEEEEEEKEEDVPLSEAEFDDDADVVPFTKLTINNKAALADSLARIELEWSKLPFNEGQQITYHTKVEEDIKDIYDDTERELQFFKQGLDAAVQGRKKLMALNIPFSRPMDYFAEMVKSDEHMDKLKAIMVKEASEKKAREEARKQRQLKKFGKQVQHETLQQRQKDKRDTLEKIKSLKKKRKNNEIGGDDFDIAVEEASGLGEEKQRSKKQKIQQRASQKSVGKKRPGKNRRRNKRKN
ncbi:Ebp2 protein [Martiniozyma asiatica (nom. inval.)]|nr:Ebp2 protein [Martiniozyma asiatica]